MQNEAEILLKKMQEFQEQELADLGSLVMQKLTSPGVEMRTIKTNEIVRITLPDLRHWHIVAGLSYHDRVAAAWDCPLLWCVFT